MNKIWFFLAGIFAGMVFLGGHWLFSIIPALACFFLAYTGNKAGNKSGNNFGFLGGNKTGNKQAANADLNKQNLSAQNRATPRKGIPITAPEHAEQNFEEQRQDTTRAFLKGDMVIAGGEAQAREARRLALLEVEDQIDKAIFDGLALLKQTIAHGHTYAVLFPGKKEGMYFRAWITDSESLIPGATLQSNQGLVGQLLKDNVKRVLEGDIAADSTLLHYYIASEEGIRSLAGIPILLKGVKRGAVIVDSLMANAFDASTLENLELLANLVGQLAYQAYMSLEHSYHKDQLAALSNYQHKFLENMSVENIVTHVQNYMAECLEGDIFLVVQRISQNAPEARIASCLGIGEKDLQGFEFSLDEKGLVALVFEKEQVINRAFPASPHVPRFSPREKPSGKMASLLAVPVPTDLGIDMVLVVESRKPRRFSEHQHNMLVTISRAAGFALSRARLYQEKEQLASRDGLTGVENHRTFQERFKNEILRAQRYEHQIAVLMIDIDFFKKVNDNYGHPIGDVVLKEVAQIISHNIRAGADFMARYGGEEFVCMLGDTDKDRATETAERIRESVAAKNFDHNGTAFSVTLSIGAAIYPTDSKHGQELLEKADKALYRAKETGRNRLVFYN